MRTILILAALVAACLAAPASDQKQTDELAKKADSAPAVVVPLTSTGLSRPSPINPAVLSDPKPDDQLFRCPIHKTSEGRSKRCGPTPVDEQKQPAKVTEESHNKQKRDHHEAHDKNEKTEESKKLEKSVEEKPAKVEKPTSVKAHESLQHSPDKVHSRQKRDHHEGHDKSAEHKHENEHENKDKITKSEDKKPEAHKPESHDHDHEHHHSARDIHEEPKKLDTKQAEHAEHPYTLQHRIIGDEEAKQLAANTKLNEKKTDKDSAEKKDEHVLDEKLKAHRNVRDIPVPVFLPTKDPKSDESKSEEKSSEEKKSDKDNLNHKVPLAEAHQHTHDTSSTTRHPAIRNQPVPVAELFARPKQTQPEEHAHEHEEHVQAKPAVKSDEKA